MAVDIGTLAASITARTDGYEKGAERVSRATDRMSQRMKVSTVAAGALIGMLATKGLSALAGYVKGTFSAIDTTAKFSRETGIAIDRLQGLRHAADQMTRGGAEALDKALTKMNLNIGKAISEGGSAEAMFDRLGLSIHNLAELPADERFRLIADSIRTLPTHAERTAAAFAIFGQSGGRLIEMLEAGSGVLDAFDRDMRHLQGTLTNTDTGKVEAMNDSIDRLGKATTGTFQRLAVFVAPAVTMFANVVTEGFVWMRKVIEGVTERVSGVVARTFQWFVTTLLPYQVTFVETIIAGWVMLWNIGRAVWDAIAGLLSPVFARFDGFGSGVTGIMEGIQVGLLYLQFAFENWRDVLNLAVDRTLLGIVTFAAEVWHTFAERIPAVLVWFADNWRDVFQTMWNGVSAFATNVTTNIVNLVSAVADAVRGRGWTFEWTGLLEGFENTLREVPHIAEREMGFLEIALRQQVSDAQNRLGRDASEFVEQGLLRNQRRAESVADWFGNLGVPMEGLGTLDLSFDEIDLPAGDAIDELELASDTLDGVSNSLDDVAHGADEARRAMDRLGGSAVVESLDRIVSGPSSWISGGGATSGAAITAAATQEITGRAATAGVSPDPRSASAPSQEQWQELMALLRQFGVQGVPAGVG